jgi:hypothetical protein
MALKATSRVWLFDLDNTLHNATPHIFPHINRSMVSYIREHLSVDEGEATRLRQEYWQRYGATLLGLMRHHGTDPHHFLRHTHQFPDLKHMLVLERGLKAMLLRLPGRKFVFSNAPLQLQRGGTRTRRHRDLLRRGLLGRAHPLSTQAGRWRLPLPVAQRAPACPSLHHG